MITCGNDEEDPLLEAGAQTEFQSLITETTPNGCAGMTDDLDSSFLDQLVEQDDDDDDDDDDDNNPSIPSLSPPLPKLKSFKEAIYALEDVTSFLEHHRHIKEAMELGIIIDNIVNLKFSSLKQTNLCAFFSKLLINSSIIEV